MSHIPTSPRRFALARAGEICALKRCFAQIAGERPSVKFVDLWPTLATAHGCLRREFTSNRLHLNGPGDVAGVAVLTPLVQRYLSMDEPAPW